MIRATTPPVWGDPMHARPPAPPQGAARRRVVAGALLALVGAGVWLLTVVAQQRVAGAPILLNPCNGELITLRDSSHLLPHVARGQAGSHEASVNAVGLSGVGTRGTYYLPMGTGKVVLTLARGSIDLAVGGDLELVSRAAQNHDFRLHGIGHLRLSAVRGFGGSGLAVRSRCGP